jgi:hypothetical protein
MCVKSDKITSILYAPSTLSNLLFLYPKFMLILIKTLFIPKFFSLFCSPSMCPMNFIYYFTSVLYFSLPCRSIRELFIICVCVIFSSFVNDHPFWIYLKVLWFEVSVCQTFVFF